MNDVMIDFETLGLSEGAVVIQIGACYFSRDTGPSKELNKRLLLNIDPKSYKEYSLRSDIDPSTVMFWLSQSKEAQDKVANPSNMVSVYDAFKKLNDFFQGNPNIWCHPSFDFKMLDFRVEELGFKKNYNFYKARDLRTMIDVSGYDYKKHPFNGTKHTALDDCLFQISYLVECFKKIGV